MRYKSPLNIYVVWHEEFLQGKEIAEHIYSFFTRDIKNPLSRGLNIPVFFRYKALANGVPLPIALDETIERSMIIALIDQKCLLNSEWRAYIEQLHNVYENKETDRKDMHRFIPVAISNAAYKISNSIRRENFINLYEYEKLEEQKDELIIRVTHELCRLIYSKPRISDIPTSYAGKKLSLFLSYARFDGKTITENIDNYFNQKTSLNTFFDKKDIPYGYRFDTVIDENLKESTLLVILTDAYASREWCRWEVLKAKKYSRPFVIVNAIKEKEDRSFPYLGNGPVCMYKQESIKIIFHTILFETLRFEYAKRLIQNQIEAFDIEKKGLKIMGSPPELLTLLDRTTNSIKVVVYPDPPLTSEEREILLELDPFEFMTPTTLFTLDKNEL
ncbi:toll/interleukin-1 receptor domain-containing protein [Runella limosa]|uniref:toll/interleukin-1 receptor domain-containing protein n=1 Tax=Runella limosa TaxID=370978 RepID=UPI000416E413|nr:toll/interleukin-1 receptor domain-containing protein [Runella limosa]